jgi:thiamine biosynthesis lipoprotein
MKTKILIILISTILILGCKHSHYPYTKISGFAQGTTYHITYENKTDKNYKNQIDSILNDFDESLSEYVPSSIISKINRNDPNVKIDKHFKIVFNKSKEITNNSEGTFDITVGPLVNAWGFGPEKKAKINRALIDSLLQFIGMNKVRIEGDKLIKEKPGIKIDVNAIAQGYSVDVVCEFFEKERIKNYLVEIGGELKAKGKNPKGHLWRVGIDKPVEGNDAPGESIQAILEFTNKAMSTSGNYRKFYIENGVKYAHHIDPHTGYPTRNNLLSVTIIADDCITADGNATACLVMGLEKTRKYLQKHKELDAFLVYSDENGNFKTEYTPSVKKWLTK